MKLTKAIITEDNHLQVAIEVKDRTVGLGTYFSNDIDAKHAQDLVVAIFRETGRNG